MDVALVSTSVRGIVSPVEDQSHDAFINCYVHVYTFTRLPHTERREGGSLRVEMSVALGSVRGIGSPV